MRVEWSEIAGTGADRFDGQAVELSGWPATASPAATASYLLLVPEPSCCHGCLPTDPLACVEVFAPAGVPVQAGPLRLRGRWHRLQADPHGWRYQLVDAVPAQNGRAMPGGGLGRRGMLAAPLLCLPVAAQAVGGANADVMRIEAARAVLSGRATLDMHSHAGSLLPIRPERWDTPFTPLADPMRAGGLAVVCLAIVSDLPALRITAEGRISAFRTVVAGELRAVAERSFQRLHALVRAQGMTVVTDAAGLAEARAANPAVLVAAEGADFLEGDAGYLQTAYERGRLRHLQLTHYRVNELGDIQTEAPVHDGLTPFGAEVIRRCQRMGIIVDVAHGTYDLVKKAVDVATKPLVLSHTSLTATPRPRTRLITAEHARLVAGTGGVIGVWPPGNLFPNLAALTAGIARMADVVGVEHVGLGTDMMGLTVPSALRGYEQLPQLAASLLDRFSPAETAGILGGNYARVAMECLH